MERVWLIHFGQHAMNSWQQGSDVSNRPPSNYGIHSSVCQWPSIFGLWEGYSVLNYSKQGSYDPLNHLNLHNTYRPDMERTWLHLKTARTSRHRGRPTKMKQLSHNRLHTIREHVSRNSPRKHLLFVAGYEVQIGRYRFAVTHDPVGIIPADATIFETWFWQK